MKKLAPAPEPDRASPVPATPPAQVKAEPGESGIHPDTRQALYLPEGAFVDFHKLGARHHLAQESAVQRNDPANEYPVDPFALDED
jgi:hypothetical protein